MSQTEKSNFITVAQGAEPIDLLGSMSNRHGLIAGATGTGKTVSLRTIAEGFSRMGVPVFMADVKGDLGGIAKAGEIGGKIKARAEELALKDFAGEAYPAVFWDVFGKKGHPLRATISEMGPLLLARLLNLNETQSSVLSIVFKIADDQGLLLLDIKDLQGLLEYTSQHSRELSKEYGNLSTASLGTIQRNIISLGEQHVDKFFGEPAINLADLMRRDSDGRGVINILAADTLMAHPKLYSTVLLWLLSELFETLPEVGDSEKPRLVFFFDEAHLLFDEAPKVLLEKIERVARLIRSKGVGIYFVTQNPLDLPDVILGQLGNRVQHALRAFTPRDQKAVRAAAETFRNDGSIEVEKVISELQVGEALVSFLDEKGMPGQVARALIYPPRSSLAPLSEVDQQAIIKNSSLYGIYEKSFDRESAYEILRARAEKEGVNPEVQPKKGSQRQGYFEAFFKSAARSIGSRLGTQIIRGILGSIKK